MSAASLASAGAGVKNLAIGIAVFAAIAGVIFIIVKRKEIGAAIDPTNQNNLANRGFNALTEAVGLTGKDETVGTKLADAVMSFKKWIGPDLPPEEEAAQILLDPSAVLHHCRLARTRYGSVKSSKCRDVLTADDRARLVSQLNS